MNKKGMSLVELIISFALVMVMVVGLYNLILEAKFQLDEKQNAKELAVFSSTINNKIHYNLLNDRKNITGICTSDECYGNDDNILKSECSKYSSCISYKINNEDSSSTIKVIAFSNVGNSKGMGIYYGKSGKVIFEPIPIDNDLIDLADRRTINFDSKSKFLEIEYPIHLKGDDSSHNYGFKIAIKLNKVVNVS